MKEKMLGKDDAEVQTGPRLKRFIDGVLAILKRNRKSAMRCYLSDSIVIRTDGVTYSEEEKLNIDNNHPRNNPFLS